jgi:hypothetical protein
MFNKYKNLLSLLLILIPIILLALCYHKHRSENKLIEGFLFGGSQDNVLTKNEVLKDIKASTNNNQPFKFSSLFNKTTPPPSSVSPPPLVTDIPDFKMKPIDISEPPIIPIKDDTPIENKENKEIIENKREPEVKPFKLDCQFFKGKCPKGYNPNGTFSAKGQHVLCGDAVDFKPAKAVAEIRNEQIMNIHVIESGKGYDSDNPPSIIINNNNNNGAVCEAIIDDDGSIKVIKVVNPGSKFKDTPIIEIKSVDDNYVQCNFCCKY